MRDVFADTSFYVALVNVRDALHEKATEFARGFSGCVVTTEFVLVELGNCLARSAHRMKFVKLVEDLRRRTSIRILPASTDLLDGGLAIYGRRADKAWSLTDCISFVVMEQMGLSEALTADRHFGQAGFTVLLA